MDEGRVTRTDMKTTWLFAVATVFLFVSGRQVRVTRINTRESWVRWVKYFEIGHSARCFTFIKDWVEKKVRQHLMRARKHKGFGWGSSMNNPNCLLVRSNCPAERTKRGNKNCTVAVRIVTK
jgi:hypothetical protein